MNYLVIQFSQKGKKFVYLLNKCRIQNVKGTKVYAERSFSHPCFPPASAPNKLPPITSYVTSEKCFMQNLSTFSRFIQMVTNIPYTFLYTLFFLKAFYTCP